ncbi:MAG TPA: ferredoxin, partial [Stellaceae bacterium]|nr:ferredoxin [Stellaceae bacterium]
TMVAERQGFDLMPEQGCRPVNKYLPPRARRAEGAGTAGATAAATPQPDTGSKFLRWLDQMLSR